MRLTLAGFLLLCALGLKPSLCLAAELSRQANGLAGWLKSTGTTKGLTALLEDNWEETERVTFPDNLLTGEKWLQGSGIIRGMRPLRSMGDTRLGSRRLALNQRCCHCW